MNVPAVDSEQSNNVTNLLDAQYYNDAKSQKLGCSHYARKVITRAPCCDKFYGCRVCHDEADYTHEIDRHALKEMKCLVCLGSKNGNIDDVAAQPIGQVCKDCNTTVGVYYCEVCKFHDDSLRQLYHCDKCGICRVGTAEAFEHCDECGCCMAKREHKCNTNILHQNCPICFEDMFNSRENCTFLKCDHAIHTACLTRMMQQNALAVCPVCRKSVGNNAFYNAQVKAYLAEHKMPPEFEHWYSRIVCQDCQVKSTVKMHLAFHQCKFCHSFNTDVERKWEQKDKTVPPEIAEEDAKVAENPPPASDDLDDDMFDEVEAEESDEDHSAEALVENQEDEDAANAMD